MSETPNPLTNLKGIGFQAKDICISLASEIMGIPIVYNERCKLSSWFYPDRLEYSCLDTDWLMHEISHFMVTPADKRLEENLGLKGVSSGGGINGIEYCYQNEIHAFLFENYIIERFDVQSRQWIIDTNLSLIPKKYGSNYEEHIASFPAVLAQIPEEIIEKFAGFFRFEEIIVEQSIAA